MDPFDVTRPVQGASHLDRTGMPYRNSSTRPDTSLHKNPDRIGSVDSVEDGGGSMVRRFDGLIILPREHK